MRTARTTAPTARMEENRAIDFVSGVSTCSTWPSMAVMWPISVSAPVAVMTPTPEPAATVVPEKAMGERSPRSASAATGSSCLSEGRDSPVSADSSMRSEVASMRRRSAGTLSPARRRTMSPGTRSWASTVSQVPPRRTSEVGESMSRMEASASAALPSWKKPTSALMRTTAVMTMVSTTWPRTAVTTAAAMST